MSKHRGILALFATIMGGCSGGEDPIDIGESRTGEKLSDYGATWEGYAEAHAFSDGSDLVRLTLDEHGQGTLVLGNLALLEPAMDPEVWPYTGSNTALQPGIEYPVIDAIVEERRLRLKTDLYVLARPWCELQTPILDDFNSTDDEQFYYCVPNLGTMHVGKGDHCYVGTPEGSAEEWEEIDCGKLGMCDLGNTCRCQAEGCTAPDTPASALDAAWAEDGDALFGTLNAGEGEEVTVRLYRTSD